MNLSGTVREHIKPLLSFGIIGGIGVVINMAVLYVLYGALSTPLWLATAIAIETAIIANFIGNYFITFKDQKTHALRKFFTFQGVSLFTAAIAWAIVNGLAFFFGTDPKWIVYLFNLGAIGIAFIANYVLNINSTWSVKRSVSFLVALVFMSGLVLSDVSARTEVSVSQLGFHPDGIKEAIVYNPLDSGSTSFSLVTHPGGSSTGVTGRALTKALSASNTEVMCQGYRDCSIADFSSFSLEGTYRIVTNEGVTSLPFTISQDVYGANLWVFVDYFDAMAQQGSSYHADFHGAYTRGESPLFPEMADGSFILEVSQAALPMIRLSEAYKANPELLSIDRYDRIGSGHPDLAEMVLIYADFLESIQGVQLTYYADGTGFRTNENLKAQNFFTPGPVAEAETSGELFVGCDPAVSDDCRAIGPDENARAPFVTGVRTIDDLELVSLCDHHSGSVYEACVDFAADFYRCQENEVCLNLTYIEDTATLAGYSGYDVSTGWYYEFGCDLDVLVDESFFNDDYNPCILFDAETSDENTAVAFHAFTASVPIIYQIDPSRAQEVYERAVLTYENALENTAGMSKPALAHVGAGLFNLYELNNDPQYLEAAASLASAIAPFDQVTYWDTQPEEFYWVSYLEHAEAAESHDITYPVSTSEVLNRFHGKLYYYHWRGEDFLPKAVSGNAERVVTQFTDWGFQNSRAQLIIGVLSEKALLRGADNPEAAYEIISESQLSWLTGKNLVKTDVHEDSPYLAYSFISGIGESINPEEQHSRYFIDTGHRSGSDGAVMGSRGTSMLHFDGNEYLYLDGRAEILGTVLGTNGNGLDGEQIIVQWDLSKTFLNGRSTIAGWINGAFIPDGDVFVYRDDVTVYEHTESTNEMVAAAVELFALQDARLNERTPLEIPSFPLGSPIERNATVTFSVDPVPATVTLSRGNQLFELQVDGSKTTSVPAGSYSITIEAVGYETEIDTSVFEAGENYELEYVLEPTSSGSEPIYAVTIGSEPEANITFGNEIDTTPSTFSVPAGNYSLVLSAIGYDTVSKIIEITGNTSLSYDLNASSEEQHNVTITSVPVSTVMIGTIAKVSPARFELESGTYTVTLRADGYETLITRIAVNDTSTFSYTLNRSTSAPVLHNVTITSVPVSNVTIAAETKVSPALFELESGTYTVTLRAVGYEMLTTTIDVESNENHTFVLTELSEDAVMIITDSTDLEDRRIGGTIYETIPVRFSIGTNVPTTIAWSVSSAGVTLQTAERSSDLNFTYAAPILFSGGTGNFRNVVVTATVPGDSRNWTYDVQGAFNAFFSSPNGPTGASNAHLVLYLNPAVFGFDNVSVMVLADRSGARTLIKTDVDDLFIDDAGVHKWDVTVPVKDGVNTLTSVILTANETLELSESPYASGISYYREFRSGSSGGGSSGGSAPRPLNQEFDLVYTLFEDDVITLGEGQILRLDARASEGDVTEVTAIISDPTGTRIDYDLELVSGTGGYGTWETSLEPLRSGQYDLVSVSMIGESKDSDTFPVTDRSFYVLGSSVEHYESLVLVYTALDATRIKPGATFTFTLDVRDSIGVTDVHATIEAGNLTITEPLTRIEGNENYGTWRFAHAPILNDTTYRITAVMLANAQNETSYAIENRAVYVESAPPIRSPFGSPLTGQATGFDMPTNSTAVIELLQRPFVPVILGFIVFGLIIAIAVMIRSK